MFTNAAQLIPRLIVGILSSGNISREVVISSGTRRGIKPSTGQCLQVIVLLVGTGPPEFNCKRICDVDAKC
jgi:hypothetical protein